MTDVLILHRIPGNKPGDVVPLTDRLQKHVDAGNAKIIPNRHDAWRAEEVARDSQPPALNLVSTGTVDDSDDDTED
jgi:hypothetical protein